MDGLKPSQPVHQGKWTPEEDEYVECLIEEFKSGLLPLAEGTSLRIFLSKMLNCDPMRISKKFVGSNYNGKQLYVRKPNTIPINEALKRRAKLQELEKKFLKRVQPLASHDQSSNNSELNASLPAASNNTNVENFLADQSSLQGGAGGNASGRVNRRAAACGRALLQGASGKGSKAGEVGLGQTPAASTLAHATSMEILAELQRRNAGNAAASAGLGAGASTKNDLMRQASCSSLDLDTAVQSRDNLLASSFARNSSNGLLDPALERALNSLSSSRNNQSVMSLSNGIERQESLASLSEFHSKRSFGSLLNPSDIATAAAAGGGGKNWSAAGQSGMSSTGASNLSELMMMHLAKSKAQTSQQDGVAALLASRSNMNSAGASSDANLRNLLLSSMNKSDSLANLGKNNFGLNSKSSAGLAQDMLANFAAEKNVTDDGNANNAAAFANLMKFTNTKNSADSAKLENLSASLGLNGFPQSQQEQTSSASDLLSKLSRNTASAQNMAALMGMSQVQENNSVGQGGLPKQLTMEEQLRQVMSARQKGSDGQSGFSMDNNRPSAASALEGLSMNNLSMDQMKLLLEARQLTSNNNAADQQNLKRSFFSENDFNLGSIDEGGALKKRRQ